MKRILTIATLASAALIANAAPAGLTATGSMTIGATLTSVCQVVSVPSPTFTYSSFQTTSSSNSSNFQVKCTNSLPYSLSVPTATITDSATNLNYTLAVSSATATGAGTAQTHSVTVTAPAGQAGTCGGATCTNAGATNNVQTLTVSY